MKILAHYVGIALCVMAAFACGAALGFDWNQVTGTAWKWHMLGLSAGMVMLFVTLSLSVAHSLTDAITKSTNTESQERSHVR